MFNQFDFDKPLHKSSNSLWNAGESDDSGLEQSPMFFNDHFVPHLNESETGMSAMRSTNDEFHSHFEDPTSSQYSMRSTDLYSCMKAPTRSTFASSSTENDVTENVDTHNYIDSGRNLNQFPTSSDRESISCQENIQAAYNSSPRNQTRRRRNSAMNRYDHNGSNRRGPASCSVTVRERLAELRTNFAQRETLSNQVQTQQWLSLNASYSAAQNPESYSAFRRVNENPTDPNLESYNNPHYLPSVPYHSFPTRQNNHGENEEISYTISFLRTSVQHTQPFVNLPNQTFPFSQEQSPPPLTVSPEIQHHFNPEVYPQTSTSVEVMDESIQHQVMQVMDAIQHGDVNFLHLYFTDNPHLRDATDHQGMQPIHHAVVQGNIQMIQYFIDSGSNLSNSNSNGENLLHLAASQSNSDVLRQLLSYMEFSYAVQSLINQHSNSSGSSPLHVAVERGNFPNAEILLNSGANWLQQDASGFSPLHIAVRNSDVRSARLLLEFAKSAYVNSGNSPFIESTLTHKLREMSSQHCNIRRNAPLHTSAALLHSLNERKLSNQLQIIELLILNHADLFAINADGNTPDRLLPPEDCSKAISRVYYLLRRELTSDQSYSSHHIL